jgi:hypothetical protein
MRLRLGARYVPLNLLILSSIVTNDLLSTPLNDHPFSAKASKTASSNSSLPTWTGLKNVLRVRGPLPGAPAELGPDWLSMAISDWASSRATTLVAFTSLAAVASAMARANSRRTASGAWC